MPSKVNPISKGSWGRYYAIHKPVAPASESLLITFQIQSAGNKQQYQAAQPQTGVRVTVSEERGKKRRQLTLIFDPGLEMLYTLLQHRGEIRAHVDWSSPDECLKRRGNGDTKRLRTERARSQRKKRRGDDGCWKSCNLELEQWKARWMER